MKELSIEEKAKRYNEAIKVAENIYRFSSDPAEIKRMEQIFPELKESEDERIRKEIKDFFSRIMLGQENFLKEDYDWNTWLAWIEKQGENANFFNKIQIGDKVTRNRDGVLVNLSQLNRVAKPAERQQKPADKIEPKFKVGDIVKHKDNPYLTYILKRFTDDGDYEFHAIGKDGHEGETCFVVVKYQDEWELVEQKPVCSEEQHEKESLSDIENRIINFAMQFHDNRMKPEAEWEDELKMLRDNIKIDPWSEEDEKMLVCVFDSLNTYAKVHPCLKSVVEDEINWLKSLKNRYTWKPSDEQMEALDDAIAICSERDYETECRLDNLRQDLKKLKQ